MAKKTIKKYMACMPRMSGSHVLVDGLHGLHASPACLPCWLAYCRHSVYQQYWQSLYTSQDCTDEEVLIEKAECLVHYSYDSSNRKLMIIDIQGSNYHLYDPEIATEEPMCADSYISVVAIFPPSTHLNKHISVISIAK